VDADAPAVFPYGGFGAIVVAGELSADRETFFAARILSFLPEYRGRRFRAPLRKVEFLNDRAVYRDSRRKVEVFLDELLLPLSSDSTWNRWKHLVGTKFGVDGTFVKCGKYRLRDPVRFRYRPNLVEARLRLLLLQSTAKAQPQVVSVPR
jgi:hypothetical protein